ncbi:MAG: DUF924 family protein [Caulobacteraceae bacterium]|nr:DUF924 family protein [Caulobacteraceae bacterium]
MTPRPSTIIAFWLEAGRKAWFVKTAAFDSAIREAFETDHFAAARGERDDWTGTADGSLALLLLLDQVPRNLWRGTAHAFATDPLARNVARAAVGRGHDRAATAALRQFFYLPFEHSEDVADQALGVELCEALDRETGDSDWLKWARLHSDIIARFGRFPHRNRCLGRETSPDEQAFLDQGGFGG